MENYRDDLPQILGIFHYKGCLVEKTKEGYVWNKKIFTSLEELEERWNDVWKTIGNNNQKSKP